MSEMARCSLVSVKEVMDVTEGQDETKHAHMHNSLVIVCNITMSLIKRGILVIKNWPWSLFQTVAIPINTINIT